MTIRPPRKKENQFVEIAKQVSDMDKASANKQQQGENPGGGTGTGPQQQGGTPATPRKSSFSFEPDAGPIIPTGDMGGCAY